MGAPRKGRLKARGMPCLKKPIKYNGLGCVKIFKRLVVLKNKYKEAV
jgi:hypothetical protein